MYLKEHPQFVLSYFPALYKCHRKIPLLDIIRTFEGALLEDGDDQTPLMIAVVSAYVHRHIALYQLFEAELAVRGLSDDENAILDDADSHQMIALAVEEHGALTTYILVVLLSLGVCDVSFLKLRDLAEKEFVSKALIDENTMIAVDLTQQHDTLLTTPPPILAPMARSLGRLGASQPSRPSPLSIPSFSLTEPRRVEHLKHYSLANVRKELDLSTVLQPRNKEGRLLKRSKASKPNNARVRYSH